MLKINKNHNLKEINHRDIKTPKEQVLHIFNTYHDKIFKFIKFHINNESDVDDVFQELLLSFLQHGIPVNTKNILSYIYRTITNDITDLIRKKKKYQSKLSNYAQQQSQPFLNSAPIHSAIQAEEFQKFYTIMQKRLPPRQVQALYLRYVKEYTNSETAETMGIDKKSVSRYISAGLNKIRKVSKTECEPNMC